MCEERPSSLVTSDEWETLVKSEARIKELEEQVEKLEVDLHSEKNTTAYYINRTSDWHIENERLREELGELKGLKEKLWLSEQGRSQAWEMYRAKEKEVRQLVEVIYQQNLKPVAETSLDSSSKVTKSTETVPDALTEPTSGPSWQPLPRKSIIRRSDDA